MRKYYEAYDDRYRQVHGENLNWFAGTPSGIVSEVIADFSVPDKAKMLEVGCGEGRDAYFLLERGCDLLATDISSEAISWCVRQHPEFADRFRTLDCITQRLEEKFDFIYAVAVVHMLVEDADRDGFYRFIREQLRDGGIALICSMGDGSMERSSDTASAFRLQERVHEESGKTVSIAGTSYRSVSFDTFTKEIQRNGLKILKTCLTSIEPDYGTTMYAAVTKE